MPVCNDRQMRQTLYERLVCILDRHRTWLEVADALSVQKHTALQNDCLSVILCRVLVVRAARHHHPYRKGKMWQIPECDLERAIQTIRSADPEFRRRISADSPSLEDVERIIQTATHGLLRPELSELPIYTCHYTFKQKTL